MVRPFPGSSPPKGVCNRVPTLVSCGVESTRPRAEPPPRSHPPEPQWSSGPRVSQRAFNATPVHNCACWCLRNLLDRNHHLTHPRVTAWGLDPPTLDPPPCPAVRIAARTHRRRDVFLHGCRHPSMLQLIVCDLSTYYCTESPLFFLSSFSGCNDPNALYPQYVPCVVVRGPGQP